VPTTGQWQEPGDRVPTFTLDMFEHSQAGALDGATYYIQARNWALALMSPSPFLMICQAPICLRNAATMTQDQALGRHAVGARQWPEGWSILRAPPADTESEWIVRVHLNITAGTVVDRTGKVVLRQTSSTTVADLHMAWTGTMWRVADDTLAVS
jgi:hypothetical protein